MKFRGIITATLLGMLIAGCSLLPSKWDDNEAAGVTDLYVSVLHLNCTLDPVLIKHMVADVGEKHDWVLSYVQLKGTSDIESLLLKMEETLDPMLESETISRSYCSLKQRVLLTQAETIAQTVMRRFE